MKVTIDVPQEFVSEYKDDRFLDSLERLKHDAHLLAGNYEKELVDMLIKAFKNANEDETPKLPTPPHPRWKPKSGEMYCFIDDRGHLAGLHWSGDQFDSHQFNIGNIFKLDDDAIFVIERLKVLAEMREWAGNWNDDWVLQYDSEADTILPVSYFDNTKRYGEMTFLTDDDADNCIKAVGEDRIKKYYFMVPETK